jgi:hypothetical protein
MSALKGSRFFQICIFGTNNAINSKRGRCSDRRMAAGAQIRGSSRSFIIRSALDSPCFSFLLRHMKALGMREFSGPFQKFGYPGFRLFSKLIRMKAAVEPENGWIGSKPG